MIRFNGERIAFFRQLASHIGPFAKYIKCIYNAEALQNILIQFKNNKKWTAAHVAAELEIVECFENDDFMKEMEGCLKDEEITPLHVACKVFSSSPLLSSFHLFVYDMS